MIMTDLNNISNESIEHMNKILNILYSNKNKKKERPKITIKLKSTVKPDEVMEFNEWANHINSMCNKTFKNIG